MLAELASLAGTGGTPVIIKDTKVLVVRVGDVVVKAHPKGTDAKELMARLDVRLPGLMLPVLRVERLGERIVTVWPAGEPMRPEDLDEAPWEEAARLLARLHATPLPPGLPMMGGPERVRRETGRLQPGDLPLEAYPALDLAQRRRVLTHGDWHFGQIIRYEGRWLLIDPDDLGWGDPAWDLARPAAWYANGWLSPDEWQRFLGTYVECGGTAVTPGDPWRELDGPARALTVQLAATALANSRRDAVELDEVAQALISSCGRILAARPTP